MDFILTREIVCDIRHFVISEFVVIIQFPRYPDNHDTIRGMNISEVVIPRNQCNLRSYATVKDG